MTHRVRRLLARGGVLAWVGLLLCSTSSQAWLLNIGGNDPRRVFLQVGLGHTDISQWGSDVATINQVSLTLDGTVLGNGSAQAMGSNSSQSSSSYDGFTLCNPPAEVYVGAAYQRTNTSQSSTASLQVSSPVSLTSAAGDTIAFSQISWTTSAIDSDQPDIIPPGSFNGGTQTLLVLNANSMAENCHSFSYANTVVPAPGTYDGRVTYTLTSP